MISKVFEKKSEYLNRMNLILPNDARRVKTDLRPFDTHFERKSDIKCVRLNEKKKIKKILKRVIYLFIFSKNL